MADNVSNINEAKQKDETRMPTREELTTLRREVNSHQASMDEARGEMATLIKSAADKKNVHKKAFKTINTILNMDDDKRDAFLSHFDLYRKLLGVDEGRTANLFDSDRVAAE